MDLDHPALQLPYVAHILQVNCEDDHGEGAKTEVVAEIQEVHSTGALFDADHLAGDALDFADMFSGLLKGKTVAAGERAAQQEQQQLGAQYPHGKMPDRRKNGFPGTKLPGNDKAWSPRVFGDCTVKARQEGDSRQEKINGFPEMETDKGQHPGRPRSQAEGNLS
ncbi:MAG TPA: hypothetical protein VGZ28_00510 [Terriglobales bacterium]|nr:hypothetical protein [Terriglobales bacterium]